MKLASVVAALVVLLVPVSAWAHVERPAYWPDPAPDNSVNPPTGGSVPKARSLSSGLPAGKAGKRRTGVFKAGRSFKPRKGAGKVRVVCQPGSLKRAKRAIRTAQTKGYNDRPTVPRKLSKKQAARLLRANETFFANCGYREIQLAVTRSRNKDRVIVMPGIYAEPTSRKKPTHDPKCQKYLTDGDRPNTPGALSYAYQFYCPNDQNLISVVGRGIGPGSDPKPPRHDRHGIPNTGPCIRCNFQIEGSGPSADSTIVDAGRVQSGNGAPHESAKDVGIRADRADGFVLRRLNVRHAGEHGIYVMESDGYLLDRFKAFYSRLYGVLAFVEDHGLIQNCEAVGHGDSGVYPGAPVETGEQRPAGTPARLNQEVRNCDLHHNLAGYSATDGNAVHVHDNNFYGNSLGLQTDVATAAGHPGFPGDSSLFENNNFYSNNFNTYDPDSDVEPAFPYPVGTGLWIAGGNNHTVRNNRFWDNWRRGTMIFAVPDSLVCGPAADGNEQAGCDANKFSTSHRNKTYNNTMGIAPDGAAVPNGLDFWWDDFPGNQANCWYDNKGAGPITTSPSPLPDCNGGKDPSTSMGKGNPANEGELLSCLAAFESRDYSGGTCPWFKTPPKPGSQAAKREKRRAKQAGMAQRFYDFCRKAGPVQTCMAYESARSGH